MDYVVASGIGRNTHERNECSIASVVAVVAVGEVEARMWLDCDRGGHHPPSIMEEGMPPIKHAPIPPLELYQLQKSLPGVTRDGNDTGRGGGVSWYQYW